MKTRELVKKLYAAIINGQQRLQQKLYEKITKKSLKHKRTHAVK